jgi:PAS domain S-box-containing protein
MNAKTYEELLEENELLKQAIDNNPNIVMIKDFDGKFLLVNNALASLYGTSPAQMIGKSDIDFNPNAEQVEFYKKNCQEIMQKGLMQEVYESSTDVSSGKTTQYKSIKTPFKTRNNEQRLLVVAADITEIVDSKERIALSEKRLNYVFKTLQEGIWDWSVDTGALEHNDTWFDILGYSNDELVKTIDAFKLVLYPDDLPTVFEKVEYAMSTDSMYVSEHRLVKKDGSIIWVRDRGAVVERDEDGKPLRMTGSFLDITSRKEAEDELRELNINLNQKIKDALEKVRQADSLLQTKARQALVGEMIGYVAHQWRQPLTALGMSIQSIPLEFKFGGVDEQYLDAFEDDAMRIIQRMSKMIDNFRNFFAPDEEKKVLCVEEAIEDTINIVSPQFNKHGITIEKSYTGNHYCDGYRNEFIQVILNLFTNSKEAILKNNIEHGQIKVSVKAKNGFITIDVTDNGKGIEEDTISKVFEPYFTTKHQAQGTGISLYMSKQIIEKHHEGEISAINVADGVKFTIEILEHNH